MAYSLSATDVEKLRAFFARHADFFDALAGFEREFPTPDHSNIQVGESAACSSARNLEQRKLDLELLALTQAGDCLVPSVVTREDLDTNTLDPEHLAQLGVSATPAVCCALKIAYDGTSFAGFARQPGLLTVQGSLEQALQILFHAPIQVECSGRTDAGVHAKAQVVSFNLPLEALNGRKPAAIRRSLQALVDDHIAIQDFSVAPKGFSARFSALAREYHYHIHPGQVPALFSRNCSWGVRQDLDLAAMRASAQYLVGEHDFASFCTKVAADKGSTIRQVNAVDILEEQVFGEDLITIRIAGNAFLHNMVRIMVGSLVMVGRGSKPASWIKQALLARDRTAAGETAPPLGLIFWDVQYPCPIFNAKITQEFFEVLGRV